MNYSWIKNSQKVDNSGNYIEFKGLTIISNIDNTQKEYFNEIFIDEITTRYALLPSSSYHMTICSVTDHRKTPDIDKFILEHHSNFTNANNYPSEHKIIAKISDIVVEGVIALNLELISSDIELIKNYCNNLNLPHKVPKQFHMTLGYLYRDITKEERDRIYDSLKIKINNELIFDVAKLVRFDKLDVFYEILT